MNKKCARPVVLSRTVVVAAFALALSSPLYAADTEPTATRAAADLAAVSETKPADNSARNARDAAGDKVTPLDQSDADSDVEMTRAIRKMLVDDDTLGMNAQNVKVITVDGKVTLRGPVATADERARVVAVATKTAGADRVVNELEVIKR